VAVDAELIGGLRRVPEQSNRIRRVRVVAARASKSSAWPSRVSLPAYLMALLFNPKDSMSALERLLVALLAYLVSIGHKDIAVRRRVRHMAFQALAGSHRWVDVLLRKLRLPVAVEAEIRRLCLQ